MNIFSYIVLKRVAFGITFLEYLSFGCPLSRDDNLPYPHGDPHVPPRMGR